MTESNQIEDTDQELKRGECEFAPFVHLWQATLLNAITDLRSDIRHRRHTRKGAAFNASDLPTWRWFANDQAYPTSFVWVCDLCDFDPDRVRNALRRQLKI